MSSKATTRRSWPLRVLIVDDEPAQLRVFSRILTAGGYQTVPVASPQEALALARTADFALIDISMPQVDGIELLRRLRAQSATSRIPAILMTGIAMPESLVLAASTGLDGVAIFAKAGPVAPLFGMIETALKSSPSAPVSRLLRRGALSADPEHRRAWIGGAEIRRLPTRRFELLCELMRGDAPKSRLTLLRAVWNENENINNVDVNVLRLREDLKDHLAIEIATVPPGYQLIVHPAAPRR